MRRDFLSGLKNFKNTIRKVYANEIWLNKPKIVKCDKMSIQINGSSSSYDSLFCLFDSFEFFSWMIFHK